MVYCTKCGTQNPDDAVNCKNCGAPLNPPPYKEYPTYRKRWDEDACFGRSYIWSVVIGLFILILGVSALLGDYYPWASFDRLWPLLIIFIGLLVLVNAFRHK